MSALQRKGGNNRAWERMKRRRGTTNKQLFHLFRIKVMVFDWQRQVFCHYFFTESLTRDTEEVERKEKSNVSKAQNGFVVFPGKSHIHTMSVHPPIYPFLWLYIHKLQLQQAGQGGPDVLLPSHNIKLFIRSPK